jgi:hypothetical protein
MFYLCSLEARDVPVIFGVFGIPGRGESSPPKYPNIQIVILGQKQDSTGAVSSYLLFSDTLVDELTKHSSIPEGYEFIFRQEWGLTITEDILYRVIETLRKESYPPMADYLDAVVKDDDLQLQKYIADCMAVKTKYPKFSW